MSIDGDEVFGRVSRDTNYREHALEDGGAKYVLLDDDRAAVVKAAYDNRQGSSEIEDILLRCKVDDLCAACEALRGRKYLRNSIKCVEIEEA